MNKICDYYKSSYKNGVIQTSRCIKYNKNIDVHKNDCIECNKGEINIDDILVNQDNEKPMTRLELYNILSSTFKIIAEQIDNMDERLKKLEVEKKCKKEKKSLQQ